MKTKYYILFTFIFIIGVLVALIGLGDIFTQELWTISHKFTYSIDVCIFMIGVIITVYSVRKIDGK